MPVGYAADKCLSKDWTTNPTGVYGFVFFENIPVVSYVEDKTGELHHCPCFNNMQQMN